jgi:hypothetical protein
MSATTITTVFIPPALYYTCTQELITNQRFQDTSYNIVYKDGGYYVEFDKRIDALSFAYLWDLTLDIE